MTMRLRPRFALMYSTTSCRSVPMGRRWALSSGSKARLPSEPRTISAFVRRSREWAGNPPSPSPPMPTMGTFAPELLMRRWYRAGGTMSTGSPQASPQGEPPAQAGGVFALPEPPPAYAGGSPVGRAIAASRDSTYNHTNFPARRRIVRERASEVGQWPRPGHLLDSHRAAARRSQGPPCGLLVLLLGRIRRAQLVLRDANHSADVPHDGAALHRPDRQRDLLCV